MKAALKANKGWLPPCQHLPKGTCYFGVECPWPHQTEGEYVSKAYYSEVMGIKDNGEGNLENDDDEDYDDYTADENEQFDLGSDDEGSDAGFGNWAQEQPESAGDYTADDQEGSEEEDDFTVDEGGSQADVAPTGASSSESSEEEWTVPP